MLYNGERVGNGDGPECRLRRRPGRRHHPDGQGHAERDHRARGRRARRDVRPVGRVLHGEDRRRPRRRRRRSTSRTRLAENIRRVAKAKRRAARRHHRLHPRSAAARKLVKEIREAGARIKLISDGDVAGAIIAARPGTGIDMLVGIGGTPEGIIAACAIKCIGGTIQGKPGPEGRRGAAQGARRRPRPRPGPDHRRPRQRRQRVLRRHRRHRRRAAPGRALPRAAARRPTRWSCAPRAARSRDDQTRAPPHPPGAYSRSTTSATRPPRRRCPERAPPAAQPT